jgi:hypothetical protein
MSKIGDIVSAIKTACEAVSVTGGFNNDLSGKVHVRMPAPYTLDEDFLVNIINGESQLADTVTGGGSTITRKYVNVTFRVIAGTDEKVQSLIVDLNKVCGQNTTWGGKAIYTTWVSEDPGNPEQAEEKTYAGSLEVQILYQTLEWES